MDFRGSRLVDLRVYSLQGEIHALAAGPAHLRPGFSARATRPAGLLAGWWRVSAWWRVDRGIARQTLPGTGTLHRKPGISGHDSMIVERYPRQRRKVSAKPRRIPEARPAPALPGDQNP